MLLTILCSPQKIDIEEKKRIVKKYDITFNVRNGCGEKGLALNIRNQLIDKGFNVLAFGNADKFLYRKTILLVQKNDQEKKIKVKEILNISRIYPQIKKNSIYDFVLIVGEDWEKYFENGE
ncbi:MAG: LytR C-terminal domain-containing protein [Candidatus Cloacimonetes bacterium]|nr:LytR C-terminal domain-containing protein [Candidatus Cloacimonadota bacterium]